MKNGDWRLTNQMNYLFGKRLKKQAFHITRDEWDHEHCAFCSEKIDESTGEAYSTTDNYHWICKECFEDFKELFKWEL